MRKEPHKTKRNVVENIYLARGFELVVFSADLGIEGGGVALPLVCGVVGATLLPRFAFVAVVTTGVDGASLSSSSSSSTAFFVLRPLEDPSGASSLARFLSEEGAGLAERFFGGGEGSGTASGLRLGGIIGKARRVTMRLDQEATV